MGLEKIVDSVIMDEDPELMDHYHWSCGMVVESGVMAEVIMYVLEVSDQFGPTRWNPITQKIEFGISYSNFGGTPSAYERYYNEFKSRYMLN
jgi:hypothetical protein